MNPWAGISLVLASLALLLTGCHILGRRLGLPAEFSRKLVHMGMGLICTLFPLLFQEIWPVLLLAACAVVLLLLVRTSAVLRTSIGASLHQVQRSSLGEIFFPVAVATVWYLSLDTPLYYSLSVLVLTLADAFAALIGTEYGKKRYTTLEGYKTWEGSAMFFAATFLSIHIPLLLLTSTGRAETLLIALLIAILVTIVEAVAWRGLDNLFIPLGVCILLNVYDSYSVSQIAFRIVFIVLTIALLFFLSCRTKLDDASILAAGLITYLAVTVGGWPWAIAPVILLAHYLYLQYSKKIAVEGVHNIYALLAVTLPGLVWLLLYQNQKEELFFFSYNLAYMAELGCIFLAHWAFEDKQRTLFRITVHASLASFIAIMAPYFILHYTNISSLHIGLSLGCALLAPQLFRILQPQIRDCPLDKQRFIRQGLIGFSLSAMPFICIYKSM